MSVRPGSVQPGSWLSILSELDLSNVVWPGDLDASGRLIPVAKVAEKLAAVAAAPGIYTVVLPTANAGDLLDDDYHAVLGVSWLWHDRTRRLFIVLADTVQEAVLRYRESLAMRDSPVLDTRPRLSTEYLVPRVDLRKVVGRFVATSRSGYLMLVGEMGTGKTFGIFEMLANGADWLDTDVVHHFVDGRIPETTDPSAIAGNVYGRLRRKYDMFGAAGGGSSIVERLRALLRLVGAKRTASGAGPEVIFVEGVNQIQGASDGRTGAGIISDGLLGPLPDGIVVVMTSTPRPAGALPTTGITQISVDDTAGYRDAVRAYLVRRNSALPNPLEEAQLDAIAASGATFLTATSYLDELAAGPSSSRDRTLRTDPGAWRTPPLSVIWDEMNRIDGALVDQGIAPGTALDVLAIMAVAQEPLCENALRALGLWFEGISDVVLREAASFFVSRPPYPQPANPYEFAHPGYRRFVQQRMDDEALMALHRRFAKGCAKARRAARGYAWRYWIAHAIGATDFADAGSRSRLERVVGSRTLMAARVEHGLLRYVVADMLRLEPPPGRRDDASLSDSATSRSHSLVAGLAAALVEAMEHWPLLGLEARRDAGTGLAGDAASDSEDDLRSPWSQLRIAVHDAYGPYGHWPSALRDSLVGSDHPVIAMFVAETLVLEDRVGQAAAVLEQHAPRPAAVSAFASRAGAAQGTGSGAAVGSDLSAARELAALEAAVALASMYSMLGRQNDALRILGGVATECGLRLEAVSSTPRRRRSGTPRDSGAPTDDGWRYAQEIAWWGHYHAAIAHRRLAMYDLARATLLDLQRGINTSGALTPARTDLLTSVEQQLAVIDCHQGRLAGAASKLQAIMDRRAPGYRQAYDHALAGLIAACRGNEDLMEREFRESIDIAHRYGNFRYERSARQAIRVCRAVCHVVTTSPDVIHTVELASRFHLDAEQLAEVFGILWEQMAGYVALCDPETGQPNGRAVTYAAAHESGLWHPTIAVVAFDADGLIALQRRNKPRGAGLWDVSAAGHQLPAESDVRLLAADSVPAAERVPDDTLAAARHIREELGLDVAPERFIRFGGPYGFHKVDHAAPGPNAERMSVFLLRVQAKERKLVRPAKGGSATEVRWISAVEARNQYRTDPNLYAGAFKHLLGEDDDAVPLMEAVAYVVEARRRRAQRRSRHTETGRDIC